MKTFKTLLATATAALILSIPALANGNTAPAALVASHVDRLVSDAKKVQTEARGIAVFLKAKQPDLAAVSAGMSQLADHVSRLEESVAGFEPLHSSMTPKQQAEFDRLKSAVAVLKIFLNNKSDILAGAGALEQRNLLRAKADGIAKRAELIQVSAHRLRS